MSLIFTGPRSTTKLTRVGLVLCAIVWSLSLSACMGKKSPQDAQSNSNSTTATASTSPNMQDAPATKPTPKKFTPPRKDYLYLNAVEDAEFEIKPIEVPDKAPAEVTAIAPAKTALKRAQFVVERFAPKTAPLDPTDIPIGQRGTVPFNFKILGKDDDSCIGKFQGYGRLYAFYGVATSSMTPDQIVEFHGEWRASGEFQFEGNTVFILKPVEKTPERERALLLGKQLLEKVQAEYEEKKASLLNAKRRAETTALAESKAKALEQWPLLPQSEPINSRAKAQRIHDEGLAKLTAEAKKNVALAYKEPE